MAEYIIGIDLGTTNSMASCVTDAGAEIVENAQESSYTPSMVALNSAQTLIGIAARDQRLEEPGNTIYSFKRFMGRGTGDVQEDLSSLPFKVTSGERENLLLGPEGRERSPEELSAIILKEIKEKSERILADKVEKAVITVPAYFDDGQRQATRDAAQIAGLEVVRIINEPTAAAIAYGLDEKKKGLIAVYDFGGGTFDVSILDLKGKIFKVLATHGNTHLGGDDIDHLLMAEIVKELIPADKQSDLSAEVTQYLKHIAEEIKIELSKSLDLTTNINIPSLEINTDFKITRERYDEIIRSKVEETLEHLNLALQDAGKTKEDIDEVVMVGGSTRIPLVRKMVGDYLNLTPHVRINPDQVVAIGAGIQGHLLAGGRRDYLLMDVIPLSLGIETFGGIFSKLIMKNASIPAKATETFSTSVDNQTGVVINIFQGEREFVKDSRALGKFILKGLPPMPAGLPRVEVEFFVDASGLLTVSARETRSGAEAQIEVIPSHGLKRDEVDQMIRDSMNYAMEDFTQRNMVEFRNAAQKQIEGIERSWEHAQRLLSAEEQQAIENYLPELKKAMDGENPRALKAAIDKMGDLTRNLADSIMGEAARNTIIES